MRIEECVQYVLLKEQYVSLPTIGSFVRETIPSYIDGQHQIHPPQHIVSFNEERTFDDGALLKYLMHHSTLDEEAVQRILNKWIRVLQQNLDRGAPIYFQGVGILKKDGTRFLLCADTSQLNLTVTGLNALVLPKAKGIGKRRRQRTNVGVVAAISISIVVLGLLLTYWLVSPKGELQKKLPPPTAENNKMDTLRSDSTVQSLTIPDTTILNKETQQILDSTHRQVNALRVETPRPAKEKAVYYIVAGSFSSRENADKLKSELTQKGYRAEVRKITLMYRVTLGKFYDRKTGIKEINKRRSELGNDSYWLIESVEKEQ